ncbi:MarR family winged helix-turn-helix transcriptional regulator [Tabrizicola sp.]|uniref:MarR family winged helix-turn-helix transcriptional regulator n=1 Tax=Tabrizicola sp. TaxID=2005166 RepID=UPI0035B1E0FC
MTKADDQVAAVDDAPADPYILDAQIGYLLRLANQRHALIFQEHAILDLTPTQFSAMVRLLDEGECSQNELGRRTAMDVATIKGVVDRLRAKGLVNLKPDPKDKRRTTISPAGPEAELRDRLHGMGRTITEQTLAPLTRAERATLLRLLSRLA